MAAGDARPLARKGAAYRVYFPLLDNDGDLVAGAAGLDSEISKDGGAFVDCTNEATEIATSSGCYFLELTSTEMDADAVVVIVKTSTPGAKPTPIILYPEEPGDLRSDLTPAAVQAIWDALTTALTTAGSIGKRLVDNIDAAITSRSTLTASQVNAEVVDVLTVDTLPELSQAQPSATPTFRTAVMLLYMSLRNKLTQTASQMSVHNNAGTVICKSATSDDGTTFTRDTLQSGP